MSAFGGKVDMTRAMRNVRFWPKADMPKTQSMSLLGVKRTWPIAVQMSANDPKRTLEGAYPVIPMCYDAASRASGEAMRRRDFITLVGSAAAAWCSVAGAQTRRKRPVIATLATGTPTQRKGFPFLASFFNGLRELGYIEGRDFDMVARIAASNDDLPKVAEELIQLDPDVILAAASVNALAAKRATSTIPIVVAALGN